jgi:2-amino-4-hydroxy-6-hydroxymethyldihydropteridine diphosphokinase
LGYLQAARDGLLATGVGRLVAQSGVYETAPVEVAAAYEALQFLNAVVVLESEALPEDWLVWLAEVEHVLGRVRTGERNTPRTVDIDIIYAGTMCRDTRELRVPHPRWMVRGFVLAPLAEVRPDLVLPGVEEAVKDVWCDCRDGSDVVRVIESW